MVRAFSRIQRLSAALAVILVATAVINPAVSRAQNQPAGQTERKKSPQELQAEKAERNFVERNYKEALTDFQDLLTKHGAAMLDEQKAFLQLRISSCYFYMKDWDKSEKGFLEFLNKYPKGTGDIIDPQNNFRGTAQITLADVYSRQKKWDPAIDILQRLSRSPELRMEDRTRATVALTRMMEGKAKDAGGDAVKKAAEQSIEILKPILATRNYALPEIKEAANRLVELYTKAGMVKEARALQDEMSAQISGSPLDVAVANFQRIEMGDSLFEQAENEGDPDRRVQLYRSALSSYQETLRRNNISHLIDRAMEMKEAEVEAIKKRYANPNEEQQNQIARVTADKDAFVKTAENFKNNKDYDAFISYRIGLCLLELKRPWEAYIAFKDIFDTSPDFSRASTSTYYYIHTLKTIHRNKEAQALCRDFLQKYPHSDEVGDVAVLLGEISFEEEDYNEAVKQFRWARDNVKSLKLEYKEWIDWYIAAALFSNVDWEDARKAVEDFISKYPRSSQLEQMYYMRALCYFYQGLYKETLAGFDDYLTKYPNGQFRPDARYRLALVTFGLKPSNAQDNQKNINDVLKRCNEWLTEYANPPADIAQAVLRQRPEIYTLLADVYIRQYEDKDKANTQELKVKNIGKAVEYYILAAKNSRYNDQTLDNALRELNKRLPTLGKWPEMLDLYVTLYNWDPDSPKALNYLYWILRASEKLGKTEQEKRETIKAAKVDVPEEFITKSAEEILSDAIIRNINDPRKENVEMLIGDLSNRIARKARLANRNPEGPKVDAEAEVTTLLKLNEGQPSLIAQARGYYTRSEVARLMRDEEKSKENLNRIATIFKAEELSPTILGTVGDYLLAKGDYEKADSYFQYILDHFRSSDFADFGFAGKAEVLLHQGKPKEAFNLYQEAIDNGILLSKEKEIVMGRARSMLGLSDLITSGKSDGGLIEIATRLNQSAKTFAETKVKDAEKNANTAKATLATKEADKAKDVATARKEVAEADTKLATAKEQFSELEKAGRDLSSGGATADRAANETFLAVATQGFTEVSGNRAWRGEGTAFALYYLGQVEERKGKVNEAINYYRRCFLAWKKYSNVTGKAYLRTAELENEKLHQPNKAKETLIDMLRTDNPASKSPEAAKANDLLKSL